MSELPKGWIKTELEDCVDILDNERIPINSEERSRRVGEIPYYGATGQVGWIDDYLFDEELLLIGEDGAPFFEMNKNIAYLISGKSWVNNHAHVLRALAKITSNSFLKHYLNQFDFADFVNGTTRLKLTQGSMRKIPILISPLNEQKRIVEKLDKLLARVEEAKDRLEKIPVIIKRFRQSVLNAAVTGELTKDWRDHKGIEIDSWKKIYLSKTGMMSRGKSRHRPRNAPFLFGGPYPFIQTGDISNSNGRIVGHRQTYSEEGLKQSKLWPENTVCITIAANIAESAILTYPACFPDSIVGIITDNTICLSEYLEFYIRTIKNNLSTFAPATAQKNINISILNDVRMSLPLVDEQKEIVKRVEALFKKADEIEERYKKAKAYVDKLTQSILAKAFRGELVPQDPNDPPASELLKKIKLEKEGMNNDKKQKKDRRAGEPAEKLLERIKVEREKLTGSVKSKRKSISKK